MSSNRDRISELIEIAERSPNRNRWFATFGPSTLMQTFDRLQKLDPDVFEGVLAYFPIAAVTSIEVFFRQAIALGDPFAGHAGSLNKSVRFDLALIQALQGRRITLGEFISHTISLQSVEGIVSAMSAIMGRDFKAELSTTRDRWQVEIAKKHNNPIIANVDELFSDLASLFEARHIVVHELPHKLPFSKEEVRRFLDSARVFLNASNWLVSNLVAPNAPLQQSEMTRQSAERAGIADEQLKTLVERVRSLVRDDRAKQFDAAQASWEAFRKSSAEFSAAEFEGGSLQPMIYYLEREAITQNRCEVLKKLIETSEKTNR
jgi:uncharacterized protein YecT (DUF1311 family)